MFGFLLLSFAGGWFNRKGFPLFALLVSGIMGTFTRHSELFYGSGGPGHSFLFATASHLKNIGCQSSSEAVFFLGLESRVAALRCCHARESAKLIQSLNFLKVRDLQVKAD